MKKNLSIIVPAYNEERSIVACINETKKIIEENDLSYEIIVIDDGSTDLTLSKLNKNFGHDKNIKIYSHNPNMGKGYAVREGFNLSSGDLIAFIDADMDLHPSLIIDFVKYLDSREVDAVIGSKNHPDSVINYPLKRRLYSKIYYLLIKVLFRLSIKDTQTGLKLFRGEAIKEVLPYLKINHYAFDLELLVLLSKSGNKIVEAPIKLNFSKPNKGRIGIKDIWTILKDTLSLFFRVRKIMCNVRILTCLFF
jgi:glycosyltransferase involved in cell wall biosynthesis